ncbi:hypothetical protein [Culicoidibacter larvae]|uniref:Uncharacterized protein n=1 Tax=Culicoidibacter larvae TaxID=2579976 RepID=A0A5R8Q9H1_9FIRM|nr:hypothetical protein [Culicoidibacter larvae]TLG72077.1 hypothetical protein FEZ08_09600 [Culicoidibacter larvae]
MKQPKFTVVIPGGKHRDFETKFAAEQYLKSRGMRYVRNAVRRAKNQTTWIDCKGNECQLIDNKPIHF